jgi:spermidine synthase
VTPRHAIAFLFLFSGLTSLVYQVIWVRILSLFFGSDVYATAIVLSVFMGGLGLGSWCAGILADRLGRPLIIYGICEILIGVSALVFPDVLNAFRQTYQSIYRTSFETAPYLYHGFRIMVAAFTLLVPTALMGATLPFIIRQFAGRDDVLGRNVGVFYAINTLGALIGVLTTGFLLLPWLGVTRTMTGAVMANVAIGAIAIAIGARLKPVERRRAVAVRTTALGRRVLLTMMLSGFAALALEVVWMRILVQSFSATVYAFSIMLASFLFGIFAGSHVASRSVDADRQPVDSLVALELWLAATVALLAILTYAVPRVFGQLVWRLAEVTGGQFGLASVVAQSIVALTLIVVPTIMLGATFPRAVKIFTQDIDLRSHGTGSVYAVNTFGGVLGALAGAMVFLPMFGTRGSLIVVALVFLAAAAVLAGRRETAPFTHWVPLGLVAAAAVAVMLLPRQTTVNFNLQDTAGTAVLYHGEGVGQTVDILRSAHGHSVMMVNGNIEADTTLTQRRHFILKAHLPLLLHPQPRHIAVVGLGLGVTLQATTRHPGVESIRLIELSPEMVEAHEHLRDLTGSVLDNPKLRLRIDDGRNFIAMTDETFDMITADPIHPRITGVGYLYTRQYYEQIRQRLRPGGIVVQWMPMYHVSRASFDVAARTFVDVYPTATLWYVRGHALLVATMDPLVVDYRRLVERFSNALVREDFASIGIDTPEQFLATLVMDAGHLSRYLNRGERGPLNTDDNAYLEYRTPFEFLGRTEDIVDALVAYAGWDVNAVLGGASGDVRAHAAQVAENRRQRIRSELAEPLE